MHFIDHIYCCKTTAMLNIKCINAHLNISFSFCRFSRWGELGGRPAYRHHYGTGHVEQSPLQVLQDQHDPQAPLYHRCTARYRFQIPVFYTRLYFCRCTDQHSDPRVFSSESVGQNRVLYSNIVRNGLI